MVHFDVSPSLSSIMSARSEKIVKEHWKSPLPLAASIGTDPVVQSTAPLLVVPTLKLGFDGVGKGFGGPQGTFTVDRAPPDTNGDVGPNHYVQIVRAGLFSRP